MKSIDMKSGQFSVKSQARQPMVSLSLLLAEAPDAPPEVEFCNSETSPNEPSKKLKETQSHIAFIASSGSFGDI